VLALALRFSARERSAPCARVTDVWLFADSAFTRDFFVLSCHAHLLAKMRAGESAGAIARCWLSYYYCDR
jgi:hypothetical protein